MPADILDGANAPNEKCAECGAEDRKVVQREFVVEHGGESRTILDEQTLCGNCENVSYVGAQISTHELAVAAAIREIDGLLSADELKAIRSKYCLRQTDLEKMLSTGPKTWTRWERGKVPQNKTADKLIRLLAERPSLVRQFMQDSGVGNPEAEAAVAQAENDIKQAAWLSVRSEIPEAAAGAERAEYQRIFESAFRAGIEFKPISAQAA